MRDEFSEPEKRGVYRAIYERRPGTEQHPLEDLVFSERWGHRQGAAVAIGPPRPEIA